MSSPPLLAGPHNPATSTPPRPQGSVRRTTSIDTVRPEGLDGTLLVDALGRDLRTVGTDPADARVVDALALAARLEARSHTLVDIHITSGVGRHHPDRPGGPDLRPLLGSTVGPGFRRRVAEALPAERDDGSLLHLLLDDLVGAVLVSGYALLHADALAPRSGMVGAMVARMGDRCAGWALDGGFIADLRDTGRPPTPHGPPAPLLEAGDPLAWHEMAPLPPRATRRRRLDVLAPGSDGLRPIDAHFRDSHTDGDGNETVVHEYAVAGSVDPRRHLIVDLRADALVLPWVECPAAVASASRLRGGASLGDLRAFVRDELVGTSSCTHLNDTLRSLADVGTLLRHIEGR